MNYVLENTKCDKKTTLIFEVSKDSVFVLKALSYAVLI